MAITHTETSVLWSGSAYTDSIGIAGNEESLEFNLDDTCVAARIMLKADNSGTPASADVIDFWLIETVGDPDGDAVADEFADKDASTAHFLCSIDTNSVDPGRKVVQLPIPSKGAKIWADGARASTTQAITVSATILEMRSA